MTTTIHLIRHGHHALLGRRLCGRTSDVSLDQLGLQQMQRLASCIWPIPNRIQSSPQLRARESAAILAANLNLSVEITPAADEIDMGDWSSRTFIELEHDPQWRRWNSARSSHSPPNGESMEALRQRIVHHIEQIRRNADSETVAVVSHAEPIRTALLHYTGVSFDDFLSVDVDVASISTLVTDERGTHVSQINQQVQA